MGSPPKATALASASATIVRARPSGTHAPSGRLMPHLVMTRTAPRSTPLSWRARASIRSLCPSSSSLLA